MTGRGPRRIRTVFVLTTPDGAGGTERATFQLASALDRCADLDVSVLGVLREADRPHFAPDLATVPLEHLIDARPTHTDNAATTDHEPSALVDPAIEPVFSARSDRLMAERLALDAPDVVVATTPALLALLCQTAPASTAVVGVEHRATAARGASRVPLLEHGPSADALVSLTAAGSTWFQQQFGAAGPVIATIPNMLPSGFTPQSGLTQPTVVAAGRLVASKQFAHVVRAFASARRPGWRLRIFGDGPQRRPLERLVVGLGIHDHVDLVPLVADLRYELAKASMLVITSTAEGFPLVALEALAAGVPVLSYDCPVGPAEIIDDGVNGHLLPPNDIDALAACLARNMDDPAHLSALAAGARRSRARFSSTAVVEAWHDLLTAVTAAPPRRGTQRVAVPREHDVGPAAKGRGAWVPTGGLLVHIGPHKTGTTAIQSSLTADRALLAARGIIVPGTTPAPHGAVMARLGTKRGWNDAIAPGPVEAWEQLCVETRTARGTVVVSSEALCHATGDQAQLVCRELRPGPARVVITLRPLAQVLPSSWQEYVKSGWTTTFDEFLHFALIEPWSTDNPTPTFWQRQDHGRLVRRWVEALGPANVAVVVADPNDPMHLIHTFEDLLGLPRGLLPADAGPANRSLTATETELLRRLNVLVRDTVPWSRFNRVMRLGGTAHLVERRVPPPHEPKIELPPWAFERARELGAEAIEQIEATGVDVHGHLAALAGPPDSTGADRSGPHPEHSQVAIDAVTSLMEGMLVKIAELRAADRHAPPA
jgi:glycosyltransferase involved in cell wall biosynthesis